MMTPVRSQPYLPLQGRLRRHPPPCRQGNRIWRFLFGTTAPRAPPSRPLAGRVDASRSETAGWGDYANCDIVVLSRSGQTPLWHTWPDGTRPTSIHQPLIAAAAWRWGEHGVRVVPPPGAAARRHPPRQRAGGWELAAALCSHSPSICNCPALAGGGETLRRAERQNSHAIALRCRGIWSCGGIRVSRRHGPGELRRSLPTRRAEGA
jgi:hypothetical protein